MNKLLLVLCFALFAPLAPSAEAQTPVSFDFFYNSLNPYGQWLQVADYGYVWHPNNVGADWRPYADGYWAYTEDGWTWVSYEDFGWITYHYGRWLRVENVGWCWLPETEWAPAWVSWREGDDYIGWAPLPPEARFSADIGFGGGCDAAYDIGPGAYNFCVIRSFGAPSLRQVLLDPDRNPALIDTTANITNVTSRDNAIIDGGPDFRAISARTATPIQTLQLVRRTDAGDGGFARRIGNQLVVAAPNVAAPLAGVRPSRITQVLPRERVDRGWNGISDPALTAHLRDKFTRENGGRMPDGYEAGEQTQREPSTQAVPARTGAALEPFVPRTQVERETTSGVQREPARTIQPAQEPVRQQRTEAVRQEESHEENRGRTAPATEQKSSAEGVKVQQ